MVRVLTPNDADAFFNLFDEVKNAGDGVATGFSSWSQSQVQDEFRKSKGLVFDRRGLKGFILYRTMPDGFEIMLLGTQPKERKTGVMQEILRNLLGELIPGQLIWLEVHEKNESARRLYEKIGFKTAGRRPNYYPDGSACLNLAYRR